MKTLKDVIEAKKYFEDNPRDSFLEMYNCESTNLANVMLLAQSKGYSCRIEQRNKYYSPPIDDTIEILVAIFERENKVGK